MCLAPKPQKPTPAPTPPSDDAIASARNAAAQLQTQRGLLSTNKTGPLGLLSQAPVQVRTLLGG
jgi:hypothetical protein